MTSRSHFFGAALTAAWVLLLTAAPGPAAAGKAHQHGVMTLGIAVEPRRVSVQMATPLDNLVGFERAPRTEAERQRVAAMQQKLRDGATVFAIDPAAECRLVKAELVSPVLGLGAGGAAAAPAKPAAGEHADLDADFEFVCLDATRAAFIDVGLFAAFTGIQRIDVQIAAPKGQQKRTLKRPAGRVQLPR